MSDAQESSLPEALNGEGFLKLNATTTQKIPLDKIRPSTRQARKEFSQASLQELAESMARNGLLQPITVQPIGDDFELIAGERRVRAAKLLEWPVIEARVISPKSSQESAILGLVENLQREDLNAVEEAEGYHGLQEIGLTQEEISKLLGKGRTYVTQTLSLLKLPQEIRDDVSRGTISRSHAEELLRLPTEEMQLKIAKKIPGRLTVHQTSRLVDLLLGVSNVKKEKVVADKKSKSDPLTNVWSNLMSNPQSSQHGSWAVRYKKKNQWQFQVTVDQDDPMKSLLQWFSSMAKSMASAPHSANGNLEAGEKDTLQELYNDIFPDEHSRLTVVQPVTPSAKAVISEPAPAISQAPTVPDDDVQKLIAEQMSRGKLL